MGDVQVFVATFHDKNQADEALAALRTLERDDMIELADAAVVVKDESGKVHFTETADPSGRKWAARGAVAGAVVGLIFPPSILVSAAVGAGGGGLWGKLRDKGFDDSELRRVGESLPVGGSAIIAVAEEKVVERLSRDLAAYQSLATATLSADAAAVLTASEASDDAGAPETST